jgi:hypothetical protein
MRATTLRGEGAKNGSRRLMATPAARRTITTKDKSATGTPLQLFLRTLYHDFAGADCVERAEKTDSRRGRK